MPDGPWIAEDRSPPAPRLDGDVTTEDIVVGAGVAGSAIARQLAEAGRDVVLLERGRAASGASGRNAGFLLADGARSFAAVSARAGKGIAMALRGLGLGTRAVVHELAAGSADIALDACGSIRLAADETEERELRETATLLGRPLRFLEPAELAGAGFARGDYRAGLLDPQDGLMNPVRLVHAQLARLDGAAGRRFEQTTVTAVHETPAGARVETTTGRVMGKRVIVATNAWARALCDIPVRPVRAQMLEAEVSAPAPWQHAAYANGGADYWRVRSEDRVLIGGRRLVGGDAEETDVAEAGDAVQGSLDELAHDLLGTSLVRVVRRWAGIMAFTPDGLPVAGRVPGRERLYLLAGMNGQGMGWAPGLAVLAAEHLLGRSAALPDCFAPDRFGSEGTG